MSFLSSLPAISSAAPQAASSLGGGFGFENQGSLVGAPDFSGLPQLKKIGGMSPGLTKALQSLGQGFSQMGQQPQDAPLPGYQFQNFDPLQFLGSLGPNNFLGRLGQQ